MIDEYTLSAPQAGKLLGVSAQTMREWARDQQIPARRQLRGTGQRPRYWFRPSDVEAMRQARALQPIGA